MSDTTRYAVQKGFTYIELLVALAVIAALFVPVMRLFSHSLYSSTVSRDLITATNLAKWQMERLKNLNFTKEQLLQIGDGVYPPMDETPMKMNDAKWRIRRVVVKDKLPDGINLKKPVEIRVLVYRAKNKSVENSGITPDGEYSYWINRDMEEKPVVTLVTLFEDTFWKEIRPIR